MVHAILSIWYCHLLNMPELYATQAFRDVFAKSLACPVSVVERVRATQDHLSHQLSVGLMYR